MNTPMYESWLKAQPERLKKNIKKVERLQLRALKLSTEYSEVLAEIREGFETARTCAKRGSEWERMYAGAVHTTEVLGG